MLSLAIANTFVRFRNYNRNNGSGMLTVDQRKYKDLRKRLKLVKPLNFPERPKRFKRIYDLVFTQKFTKWALWDFCDPPNEPSDQFLSISFTIFTIIFNTLLFSSPIEMENLFSPAVRFLSWGFNSFLILETFFKLYIYKLVDFLRSRLYCLELFISVICVWWLQFVDLDRDANKLPLKLHNNQT